MRVITEDEMKQQFGETTFIRGVGYFKNKYVETGVKKGNKLFGKVIGSVPEPYRVTIEITDRIYSLCSCPVRDMCKHGVALLLQWLEDKSLFIDADDLLDSIKKRSKKDLIEILSSIIENYPIITSKLTLSEEIKEKRINIEAISKRIGNVANGYIDYYAVPGVVGNLEQIKKMGEILTDDGLFKNAVEFYFLLIEKCVDLFESGVDDSSGMLGDFAIECVEDCKHNLKKLEDKEKKNMINKIIELIKVEDYGLETEELLYGVATRNNIPMIEKNLLKVIPTNGDYLHIEYHRGKVLELLSDLYSYLDLYEDALRVIKEAGLKFKSDYVRLAMILIEQGKDMEAFEYVREGLQIEGKKDFLLFKLYIHLLNRLMDKKKGLECIKVEEIIKVTLEILSSHFIPDEYELIKGAFKKIGMYEQLISTIKTKCKGNIVIAVLLNDGYSKDAVEYALTSNELHPIYYIKIAKTAKEKGNKDAANKLTFKALRSGLISVDATVNELIRLFIKTSNEGELVEAIRYIHNNSLAKIFAEALMTRNQEYATRIIKKFMCEIEKRQIKDFALKLDNKLAKEICHSWINIFANRSHIYYDDVIDFLIILKEKVNVQEWNNYISRFIKDNKGKKKLLEKIRTKLIN
ncbi:MAG: hypothetical protein ACTSRG_02650 [Candidatus Helarchaeota archaeon]